MPALPSKHGGSENHTNKGVHLVHLPPTQPYYPINNPPSTQQPYSKYRERDYRHFPDTKTKYVVPIKDATKVSIDTSDSPRSNNKILHRNEGEKYSNSHNNSNESDKNNAKKNGIREKRDTTKTKKGPSSLNHTSSHKTDKGNNNSFAKQLPSTLSPSVTNPSTRERKPFTPLIILIDIDGTMIGKINPQVCEYELLTSLDGHKLGAMKTDTVERLKNGIIRPWFDWFCSTMMVQNSNVELYVYTASEENWAKFLIACVEEAIGVRFNRPLFTRKDCILVDGEYKKSIDHVTPIIAKNLRKKYKNVSQEHIAKNAMLVDNNQTVLLHPLKERERFVLVPTYNMAYWYDVLSHINLALINNDFLSIANYLVPYGLFPASQSNTRTLTSVQQFWMIYFSRLSEQIRSTIRGELDESARDHMWRKLGECIVDILNRVELTSSHDPKISKDTSVPPSVLIAKKYNNQPSYIKANEYGTPTI